MFLTSASWQKQLHREVICGRGLIVVVTLTLGLGASCFVLFFSWDLGQNFSNNHHNSKFTSSQPCLYSWEGYFQAVFGSCRKSVCRPVRKSYLWVLLVLLVDSESDGTQVWGLSNTVKWNEKLYHRKYKMMILREIFSFISKYSLLRMNLKKWLFSFFSFVLDA